MSRTLVVVGGILDLIGIVWLLQGLNVLPGSFMTGDPFWARAGVATMAIGSIIVVIGVRRSAGG